MRAAGARWRAPLAALCLLISSGVAGAEELPAPAVHTLGELEIVDPWAKGAIGLHEVKLFFEFKNAGAADRLVGAASSVADGPTRFHLVTRRDGARAVDTVPHIPIPATGKAYELSEVGYYVELYGLEVPMVMGKEFEVTLLFDKAGDITIPFTSRFHSPKLARRIRDAVQSGDLEALRALRDQTGDP